MAAEDRVQFREDMHRLLDEAFDLSRSSLADRETFDVTVRSRLGELFTVEQLDRLDDVLDAVSACAHLEKRAARIRKEQRDALAQMTDEEVRAATGGSLLGRLAFRPTLRAVQEGDAA